MDQPINLSRGQLLPGSSDEIVLAGEIPPLMPLFSFQADPAGTMYGHISDALYLELFLPQAQQEYSYPTTGPAEFAMQNTKEGVVCVYSCEVVTICADASAIGVRKVILKIDVSSFRREVPEEVDG